MVSLTQGRSFRALLVLLELSKRFLWTHNELLKSFAGPQKFINTSKKLLIDFCYILRPKKSATALLLHLAHTTTTTTKRCEERKRMNGKERFLLEKNKLCVAIHIQWSVYVVRCQISFRYKSCIQNQIDINLFKLGFLCLVSFFAFFSVPNVHGGDFEGGKTNRKTDKQGAFTHTKFHTEFFCSFFCGWLD